jgi:predicted anti-sigma-YlaC factor YlaD
MSMLFTRREIPCQEIVELITDYLQGTMSRSESRRLEAHLAGCENCSEYLRQMRVTIRASGMLREEDLTPETREEFAGMFRLWQSGEDAEPAADV